MGSPSTAFWANCVDKDVRLCGNVSLPGVSVPPSMATPGASGRSLVAGKVVSGGVPDAWCILKPGCGTWRVCKGSMLWNLAAIMQVQVAHHASHTALRRSCTTLLARGSPAGWGQGVWVGTTARGLLTTDTGPSAGREILCLFFALIHTLG